MSSFRLLEWDTATFGYKIACIEDDELNSVKVNALIKELGEMHYDLAYCFVSPDNIMANDALSKASGLLADTKVTYSIMVDDNISPIVTQNIKPYSLNYVTEKLKSLTLQSGEFSRFKVDPNFMSNEYEKLYIAWINNSVNRKLADEILIFEDNEEIMGFITLKIFNETGSIGLLAVDTKMRGKSIGRYLLNNSLKYFKDNKVKSVNVVTQKANEIACRFYESCGFKVNQTVHVYHLWIR